MKLNLPNKITLSRIFITPLVIFLYLANFIPANKIIAAIVFVIAVSTDFLDGHIARKRNLVTNMGKFLDPVADKLINVSVILLITADGVIPSPYGVLFAIVLIGRELMIGALRQIAAANGTVIAADKLGKIKTVLQDIAIPALMVLAQLNVNGLVYSASGNLLPFSAFVMVIAYGFAAVSTVLTVVSMWNYITKNKNVITQ